MLLLMNDWRTTLWKTLALFLVSRAYAVKWGALKLYLVLGMRWDNFSIADKTRG